MKRFVVSSVAATFVASVAVILGTALPASAASWIQSPDYSSQDACESAMASQAHHGRPTQGCFGYQSSIDFGFHYYFKYYA